jgi:hypothetical protein
MSGFDREADTSSKNSGAGSALVLMGVMDSINWGFSELNTGRGTESYKSQLTSVATQNWRISIRPPKSKRSRTRWFFLGVFSVWNGVAMRITCETSVMRIISKEKGAVRAIDGYISHLWNRLFRKEPETFAQKPTNADAPSNDRSSS